MHITVDYDLCESNGICVGLLPAVFELRDDDNLYVLEAEPKEELRSVLEQAVRQCPRQAITVVG